ncbi:tRNA uridine-5-carboxymethylaminomethyl(34) synthesis GTPase MnmE [Tsuneonella sp. YG55]|uniref:tRNA modification GTPase MnmE n=1 Tax=Tsuneonella litorea TaxID=2976475 RepID=A0A9X3A8I3_9SPHN|nr:tRNA uridine-5-carboxymethylaminomethyl(34) synthesis GTPase MnmE [Tsuneonella litorea]MCT2557865.1 tRNA uridine-5-carboxymethylaminomethyl(34) synthesis GTPase MnmE [Tsuneonella litorea]
MDTIFALSSGAPPAGIAVVRISGSHARGALERLAGNVPQPRRATAATLRGAEGGALDRALVLWLPGPRTATGEDIAELHLHGGRAVVAAVETELARMPGLRRAQAGEFTRRAFANGRIDLAEAEGLADLLAAETESQRRAAVAMAGGALSRQVEVWRERVLELSAAVEAVLDFGDEDDVGGLPADFSRRVGELGTDIDAWLARPSAERLRDGVRVVLAGPPNAGKSSLFNALLDTEAAIVTDIAGTTRDVIERPVAVEGVPFVLVDTAGLRSGGTDAVEIIGIERAGAELARADIVLWLGAEGEGPAGAVEVAAKSDLPGPSKSGAVATVSAMTGAGIAGLWRVLVDRAGSLLLVPGEVALNQRQRAALVVAADELRHAMGETRPLILAEQLRLARLAFDRLTGRASTENMLDGLFGRFCIGK